MSIRHTTLANLANPAATHLVDGRTWDEALTGTNDHAHTATADGGLLGISALDGLTATIDELNALDLSALPVARTATADGLTTGIIADGGLIQFVPVTSADAAHIIVLPAPDPGRIVILSNGGTGYELRTSAPATISLNGGAEADAESAIPADTLVVAICKSATEWSGLMLTGEVLASVETAAAT